MEAFQSKFFKIYLFQWIQPSNLHQHWWMSQWFRGSLMGPLLWSLSGICPLLCGSLLFLLGQRSPVLSSSLQFSVRNDKKWTVGMWIFSFIFSTFFFFHYSFRKLHVHTAYNVTFNLTCLFSIVRISYTNKSKQPLLFWKWLIFWKPHLLWIFLGFSSNWKCVSPSSRDFIL